MRSRWLRRTAECEGRVSRAAVLFKNSKNVKKQIWPYRDMPPRRRHLRRLASLEMCVSAPVCKACSRFALPAKQFANPCLQPPSATLGPCYERIVAVTLMKREAAVLV